MQTAAEEFELTEKIWRTVIGHLRRKISAKITGVPVDDGMNADLDEEDYTIEEMEHKITIYRMCIDWAREQKDSATGRFNEKHAEQRHRFYKLMAVLAKAELNRDDHLRSVAFVASEELEHPSNQESVYALESAAAKALENLVAA